MSISSSPLKEATKESEPLNYEFVRLLTSIDHNNLLGKILTVIDAIGLPETQGKAVKDITAQHFWDSYWTLPERKMLCAPHTSNPIAENEIKEIE